MAGLLSAAGKTDEAEATYRKAETLLAGLARSSPSTAAARAALADCRSRLGWLRYEHRQVRRRAGCRTAWRGPTRRRWPPPPGHRTRPGGPGGTVHRIGILLSQTGKQSEAEAEFRKALAIGQKLADDNPAVTEFRSDLAGSHNNLGLAAE